jgi:hypothetical protein
MKFKLMQRLPQPCLQGGYLPEQFRGQKPEFIGDGEHLSFGRLQIRGA